MSTVKRAILSCPSCKARVSGYELACPRCGMAFTYETKFECGFCGELVPRDQETCPSCGVDLSLPDEKPVEDNLDELSDHIVSTETKKVDAGGKRFGCPRCSHLLSGNEDKCPKCSFVFKKAGQVECPICGSLIPLTSIKCPECDWVLLSPSEMASLGKKESEVALCPLCGRESSVDVPSCPYCGAEFEEVGETDESETPTEAVSAEEPPPPELEVKNEIPEPTIEPAIESPSPVEAETSEMALCPLCGRESPEDVLSCPYCGAEFEEVGEADETEQPSEVSRDADQAMLKLEALLRDMDKTAQSEGEELKAARAATTRIPSQKGIGATDSLGKVNGIGFVNGRHAGPSSGLTNGRGLVNGVSMINGKGATNGKGLVNGVSMINGKGVTNGTGLVNGGSVTSGKRVFNPLGVGDRLRGLTGVDLRVLAVLVALMMIIPAFYIITSLAPSDDYDIDGDFGEWAGVQRYPAQVVSTSTGINIQGWSAVFSRNDFYYYIRTESDAMDSSIVESFCIFIDADSSSSTGYSLGAMGAEYRLILEGWNGTMHSSSLSYYDSSGDNLDWNNWSSVGSSEVMLEGTEIEGCANLYHIESPNPKVILISKDEAENLCYSVPVPVGGRLLIVSQAAVPDIASSGIVELGSDVQFLRVTLSALGGSGTVGAITPATNGCELVSSFTQRDVEPGVDVTNDFSVDTSSSSVTQLVAATISEDDVESDFDCVLMLGTGARAYLTEPPENVTIDGAFADWVGRVSLDTDFVPVQSANIDVQETGAVNTSQSAFFFVSTRGEICCGAYVPRLCAKPVPGAGGTYIPTKKTAEDSTKVFIDTDMSSATGSRVSYESKTIGADRMIEVRGLFGRITSSTMSEYENGGWINSGSVVEAENDEKRVEMAVSLSDLGSGGAIDFIFETTCWNGRSDLAIFDSGAVGVSALSGKPCSIMSWPVDTSVTSTTATAMSHQRKLFYDGTNFWSFIYDGSDTVYKYSTDSGASWTSRGQVFTADDVREVSIWYDSSNNIVYAIGDTSTADKTVTVKRGTVAPSTHTISWGSDYDVTLSTLDMALKDSFIAKANDGYLWLIAQDYALTNPKYNLAVYKSNSVDDVSAWTFSENVHTGDTAGTIKGVIVPAGSNGYVWAIYTYAGNVKSKKWDGAWPNNPQDILSATGTLKANTVTSPPSVVVDSRGVVHVVYGDCNETGGVAYTRVCYKSNNTDAETYPANPTYLDPSKPSGVADISPTISLETSTGNLYAFWIQTDTSMVGKIVMGSKYSGGSWTSLTLDTESSYTKQYLTSIYSVSGAFNICWQWTQNTTSPIQVIFDIVIPEFGDAVIPTGFLVIAVVLMARKKARRRTPV